MCDIRLFLLFLSMIVACKQAHPWVMSTDVEAAGSIESASGFAARACDTKVSLLARYMVQLTDIRLYYMEESVLLGTNPLVVSTRPPSLTRVTYFPFDTLVGVISLIF